VKYRLEGAWIRLTTFRAVHTTRAMRPGRDNTSVTADIRLLGGKLAEKGQRWAYYNTQVRCLPGGMARMMIAYQRWRSRHGGG